MNISALPLTPKPALRVLWGVAAIGMLFERAPWNQPGSLAAADGYLGFLAFGLWAATGAESAWSRKALMAVTVAWLAVMACRFAGMTA